MRVRCREEQHGDAELGGNVAAKVLRHEAADIRRHESHSRAARLEHQHLREQRIVRAVCRPALPVRVAVHRHERGRRDLHACDARLQFDVKFYLIAILFLVFDVELLFLYPWAVIAYGDGGDQLWRRVFGTVVFLEILVFMATFVIAYVYAWKKGVFQWR